jgi:hypothetical protein
MGINSKLKIQKENFFLKNKQRLKCYAFGMNLFTKSFKIPPKPCIYADLVTFSNKSVLDSCLNCKKPSLVCVQNPLLKVVFYRIV